MTWKDEMKRAVVDVLVREGAPLSDRPDIHNWQDDWTTLHGWRGGVHPKRQQVASVGIDYAATVYVESCWDEFMGTFYEGDTRVYGVDVDLVLLDGTRLGWRYTGTVSELITAVLAYVPVPTLDNG